MIYTHAAAAILAASIAATGAWKVQDWRLGIKAQEQAQAFDLERNNWDKKVKDAEKLIADQHDQNIERANAASALHSAETLKLNIQIKGAQREIDRLSDNLSACRLSPDLVRLLNDQSASILAPASKD